MKKLTLLFLAITLLAFTVGDNKGKYPIPAAGVSIYSCDIDLDGDIDIQIGHFYSSQTDWGGFSFLQNDSNGYFNLTDSLYTYDNQNIIYSVNILGDEIPEIIGRHYDGQQTNVAIIELNNGNYEITYYPMCNNLTSFYLGDVSGNNTDDIVFISNNDYLWGIIYNDGTGNFSAPEYYDLSYPPLDITSADLNDDGRADVVVAGGAIEVYFSYETGFEQQLLGNTLPWSSSYSLLTSDFDNDNDNDVILSTTSNSNHSNVYMFENLGYNQFYEHPYFEFTPFCSYSQIADFNNDSLPDMVFIASNNSGLYIYYNKGDFQLEYNQTIVVDSLTYWGLNCNDYDNNGYFDISVTTGVGSLDYFLEIFYNDGDGNFVENPITKIQIPKSENKNPIKCYPNPFTNKTTIEININKNEQIKLDIYDIQGKLVKTFIDRKLQTGKYKFIWEGEDQHGKEVNRGLYFVHLLSGRKIYTQRVVFVK